MNKPAIALVCVLAAAARGPGFAQNADFPNLEDIKNNSKKVLDTIKSAPPAQGLSDFASSSLDNYARKHARPFHWQELLRGGERVIYIGETHPIAAIKTELAAHMHEIKEAGITHMAFEMLADDKQGLADKYCHDGSCRVDLRDALDGPEWGYPSGPYMQVMDAAKREGLKILLINLPDAKQEEIKKRNFDPNNEFKAAHAVADARDSRMAADINKGLLENPNARILVLAGDYHVETTSQPKLLEETYGVKSKSYTFICGTIKYRDIKSVDIIRRRIAIPLPREQAFYDGVIGIPEVVKECDARPLGSVAR